MGIEILLYITQKLVISMVKFWLSFADPEYKFKVPRTNFFPQPNVSNLTFKCACMSMMLIVAFFLSALHYNTKYKNLWGRMRNQAVSFSCMCRSMQPLSHSS